MKCGHDESGLRRLRYRCNVRGCGEVHLAPFCVECGKWPSDFGATLSLKRVRKSRKPERRP